MPSTKPTQKSTQLHHSASDKIDEANGITLLLSDHERFGFSERACYHFDLVETLTQAPHNACCDNFGTQPGERVLTRLEFNGPIRFKILALVSLVTV